MTAIESAIKEAVTKGGFNFPIDSEMMTDNDRMLCLLEPAFWTALGKARGWKQFDYHRTTVRKGWLPKWHRFIDHLAAGNDAESFFKGLME